MGSVGARRRARLFELQQQACSGARPRKRRRSLPARAQEQPGFAARRLSLPRRLPVGDLSRGIFGVSRQLSRLRSHAGRALCEGRGAARRGVPHDTKGPAAGAGTGRHDRARNGRRVPPRGRRRVAVCVVLVAVRLRRAALLNATRQFNRAASTSPNNRGSSSSARPRCTSRNAGFRGVIGSRFT
jgi:hypothetical protein